MSLIELDIINELKAHTENNIIMITHKNATPEEGCARFFNFSIKLRLYLSYAEMNPNQLLMKYVYYIYVCVCIYRC